MQASSLLVCTKILMVNIAMFDVSRILLKHQHIKNIMGEVWVMWTDSIQLWLYLVQGVAGLKYDWRQKKQEERL